MVKNLFYSILIAGFFLSMSVFAQPELDTTFNSSGKVLIGIVGQSGAWNVAVQPDNKIIMVSDCAFCIVRVNENGSIDTTFGNYGQGVEATGIALQSDGKIIVVGPAQQIPHNVTAIVRLNPNGTLDTSFGTGGKINLNLTGAPSTETARSVVVQPDGKIVVTGDSVRSLPWPNIGTIWSQFVARFLPNGTLDTGFGIGGVVKNNTGNTSASGQSLAIQPDGKILVGGNLWTSIPGAPAYHAYYLSRLNPNGTFDQDWNTVQAIYSDDYAGPIDGIRKIVVLPDGRVTVLGSYTNKLMRFLPDGSADSSFDFDGARSVFTTVDRSFDFAISASGKITTVGMFYSSSLPSNFYLVERFMPDGSYDGAFGNGGRLNIDFSPSTYNGARAVAFDPLGRAVIGGFSGDITNQSPEEHAISSAARLTAPAIVPAPATITGRVRTSEGFPVSGVTVRMVDSHGVSTLARTNPFGYYQFTNVMSGQLYSIAVKSRSVSISERSLFVAGDVSNFDFTGAPQSVSKGTSKDELIGFK